MVRKYVPTCMLTPPPRALPTHHEMWRLFCAWVNKPKSGVNRKILEDSSEFWNHGWIVWEAFLAGSAAQFKIDMVGDK